MKTPRFLLDYQDDGVPDFTPNEENLEAACIGGMIQIRKYPTGIKVHEEECRIPDRHTFDSRCSMLCRLYPDDVKTVGEVEAWYADGSKIWAKRYRLRKPRKVEVQEDD